MLHGLSTYRGLNFCHLRQNVAFNFKSINFSKLYFDFKKQGVFSKDVFMPFNPFEFKISFKKNQNLFKIFEGQNKKLFVLFRQLRFFQKYL